MNRVLFLKSFFFWVLSEQYNTTKSSWMADYCKEEEEEQAPQPPAPLPWLGSSVDPSYLGPSEFSFITSVQMDFESLIS